MPEGEAASDPRDFATCVDRYYPGLVRRLTLVLHDGEEAKDVAQEAYLRAFRAWDRFDGTDVRAWLRTVALRLAFNTLRRRSLWSRFVSSRQTDASWVPPERLPLWEALASLRPRVRAALLLNVLDGYTQAEIARMLDVPPGTVASWIASGKARLREDLSDG
jgi:RNA polymerase sigma-70 factor (ECF subfamily)